MKYNPFILVALLAAACASPTPAAPATPVAEPAHARVPTKWAPGNYIINLYDAFGEANPALQQDFGFSAIVRYNGKTILFDGGTNAEVLKKNTAALGIDLRDVDFAVASHAHFDHINGFDYLLEVNPQVPIYFPADPFWGSDLPFNVSGPEAGAGAQLPDERRYFGGQKEKFVFKQSGRFWKANITFVSETTEIGPGMTLVATKSPFMGYFTRYPTPGIETDHDHGDVKTIPLPELSLNLASDGGDVLMVGCSHSVVETIVRETKKALGRPVGMVYGGYHLLPYDTQTVRAMAERMRDELGVQNVAPTHCTGHVGFRVFAEVFAQRYAFAGLGTTTSFPEAPKVALNH